MIQVLQENPDVGMVCGNRFSGYVDLKGLNQIFYFGNRLIAFAHYSLNGVSLVDPLTGLRVVRAGLLRNWKVKSKGFDVELSLIVMLNVKVLEFRRFLLSIVSGWERRSLDL